MKSPNQLSVMQALAAIENGSLTSRDLTASCLARIAERNHQVEAFVATSADKCMQQASAADAGTQGLLRGIPFAVKDVLETAHLPTSYGSPIYKGHQPRTDAACVARVKEFGGLILGKVATSEFATQSPSSTRNPLNLAHTPGGSSSGSAAAVADFMVPVAFGTQTTASTVRPASYCGIVGYKPTFGFFNVAGLKALSPIQDTITLMARTAADAAYCGYALHGQRIQLKASPTPKLALCYSSQWADLHPDMLAAIQQLQTVLVKKGVRVDAIELPSALEELIDMQSKIFAFEARQSLGDERQHHSHLFSPRLQQRLSLGEDIQASEYLAMCQRAAMGRLQVQALFQDYDALLYPPARGVADLGITDSGSAQFGALWSLLHLPCVSVPMGRGTKDLPLGIQVITQYGCDLQALSIAQLIEELRDYEPLDTAHHV